MEEVRAGKVPRIVRRRRGITQAELAALSGVSQQTVSSLECGRAAWATLLTIKRVASPLGITVDLVLKWKGPDLDRLLDARHARLVTAVVSCLGEEWQKGVEYTYNNYGDRGSVDVLAWHAANRALLLVEVKSELDGLESVLRSMDTKVRVVPQLVARERGWRARSIGSILVLPDEATARRAVARRRPVFDTVLPARTIEVRRWLRGPSGELRGIWFLADTADRRAIRNPGSSGRVRTARPGPLHAQHLADMKHEAPPGLFVGAPNASTTPITGK